MIQTTTNVDISSRHFLQICQRGDHKELHDYINRNNGMLDWSSYRHCPSGDTGLHVAAQNGHVEIVKMLCECSKNPNCNVDIMNFEGKRPLHDAAQFSRIDVVRYLLKKGATVNTFKRADWTPLMLACTKAGPEAATCIEALLQAKADPFLYNKDGWTAFLIACRAGDYNIIKLFLDTLGPKCIEHKSKNGRTALHIAAFHGHLDIINLLLPTYLPLLHTCDSSGSTPLHESVKCKHMNVTKRLIELGADVNAADHADQTMLDIAALVGNDEAINYVL